MTDSHTAYCDSKQHVHRSLSSVSVTQLLCIHSLSLAAVSYSIPESLGVSGGERLYYVDIINVEMNRNCEIANVEFILGFLATID